MQLTSTTLNNHEIKCKLVNFCNPRNPIFDGLLPRTLPRRNFAQAE